MKNTTSTSDDHGPRSAAATGAETEALPQEPAGSDPLVGPVGSSDAATERPSGSGSVPGADGSAGAAEPSRTGTAQAGTPGSPPVGSPPVGWQPPESQPVKSQQGESKAAESKAGESPRASQPPEKGSGHPPEQARRPAPAPAGVAGPVSDAAAEPTPVAAPVDPASSRYGKPPAVASERPPRPSTGSEPPARKPGHSGEPATTQLRVPSNGSAPRPNRGTTGDPSVGSGSSSEDPARPMASQSSGSHTQHARPVVLAPVAGRAPAPGPVPDPGAAAASPPPWSRVPGQDSAGPGQRGYGHQTGGHQSYGPPDGRAFTGVAGGLLDDGPTTYLRAPRHGDQAPGAQVESGQSEAGPWSAVRAVRNRPPRQAALQLKRLDPWSMLKLGLVLAVVLFFVWLVAVGVLYGVLDGMGVWDRLNGTYADLVSGEAEASEPLISAGRVFGLAAVVGAINSLLFAVAVTIGAFVYNVSADLVGGIEVTLSERD